MFSATPVFPILKLFLSDLSFDRVGGCLFVCLFVLVLVFCFFVFLLNVEMAIFTSRTTTESLPRLVCPLQLCLFCLHTIVVLDFLTQSLEIVNRCFQRAGDDDLMGVQ